MAGEIIIETEQYIGYSSPYVLNVGDIFKGSISTSPGPDDYVGVHVEEGKTYVVNVTPSSSRWPSSLRLLEEGRGLITWGDQTNVDGTATLKFVADKTGIFHLAINKGNRGVGDYEVSFEEDPDFEPWHLAEIADYLTDGYWLDAGETLARWDFGDQDGAKVLTYDATALGDTGAAAALQAFRAWTDVSGIEFVATTSAPDIYFTQGGFQAYATHEFDDGVLTRAVINMYETGFEHQGGFLVREHEVLVHEIGHALGLGHAGPYNGTGTYELDALHAADTVRTSVMSYFRSTDQAFVDMFDYDVLTPMPADIIAIQKLYGAVDINIGDTIYGQNADISNISLLPTGLLGSYSAAYQDLLGEGEANLERYIYTIKDDGGTDTLDYSRHNFGADIDLTIPELGDVTTAERNIVLAPGTIIENAISGRFSDSIIGNAVANSLSGNAGDDTLEGHGGNDILMGGANDDLLMGGSGADTLNGGSGNDDLSGGDEDDWLFAADSNDLASATNVLNGDAGNDFLQGGDGFDTLFGGADDDDLRGGNNNDFMYGDDGTDYLFGDDGQDALFGGKGEDTLYGGDDLNTVGDDGDDYIFGDDLPVTYFAETAASVYRLYQATLGREPDANGHQNWTTRVATDELSLLQAANGFVNSTEFQNTYGALGNADFVNLLYQNVLGRDADDTGLARWVGDLEGGMERAQVVLGFSNSNEFKNNTATDAAQFGQSNTQQVWTDDVFRLYQATLDRAPNVDGMFNWSERLGTGTDYLDAANGFVASQEFKNRFGEDLSNADFVELMYQNVLGRAADEGGLARWVGDLEDGASRTEVVQGFAQSSEFRNNTEDALEDWMRDNAASDEIIGGEGDDVMAGGFGSDLFVFRQTDAGSDVVLDLEAWDGIDITDFEFGDLATAQAAFTQDGTDVVFASGNVEVVFEGTDLADFDDGMLFV